MTGVILRLQLATVAWMSIEVVVSLFAAVRARSPVLLAFGSDSGVELLSAVVVLMAVSGSSRWSEERAARWAGMLLFVLAGIVGITAVFSLVRHVEARASVVGMGITAAALVVMPGLAWLKRRAARVTNNRALAADAVQSATCAYLAGIALVGLGANALFRVYWVDSVAALVVLPLLVLEGRKAMRGEACSGC